MLTIRNFGEKSLGELKENLYAKGFLSEDNEDAEDADEGDLGDVA
jgi:hypothetical protein